MSRVHPVAAAGFAAAADAYERARPGYPPEAIAWIVERAGLGPGRRLVDLAAGTGKLTRLLVPSGAEVVAVEPIPEMRAKLEEAVPGVETVDATAEELPFADGSVDVVTVAQAFHWFDPGRALRELHRVFEPDGLLVLVWNVRNLDDPLQRRVEELLAPLRVREHARAEARWRATVEASSLFGPVEERRFPHPQRLTVDGLVERVSSTSVVAAAGPAEREALLERVRALASGLPEPFPYPYVTEVQAIPRTRDRAA